MVQTNATAAADDLMMANFQCVCSSKHKVTAMVVTCGTIV